MNRSLLRLLTLVLVLLAAFALPRITHHRTTPPPPAAAPGAAPPPAAPAPARGFGAAVGFRTNERWTEHFEKHGRELDCASPEQYLRLAQDLRDRPAGGDVLEFTRDDGVVVRFDRASGVFVAFDRDGTLRTCFRPRDGEAYFRRQAQRGRS